MFCVVPRLFRRLVNARGLVADGLFVCCVVYVGWCGYSFTEQINNFIKLDLCSREISKVRKGTGAFPAVFEGHKDYYGRDVVYVHDDGHFMLLSYGSDGVPDGLDYAKLLDVPVGKRRDNCLVPSRDTVLIDGHIWQGCAK
jgi:hypothetical protein